MGLGKDVTVLTLADIFVYFFIFFLYLSAK